MEVDIENSMAAESRICPFSHNNLLSFLLIAEIVGEILSLYFARPLKLQTLWNQKNQDPNYSEPR